MNKSVTKEVHTKFFHRRAWSAVYHDLLEKDSKNPLKVDKIYDLALAAYFIGKDNECVDLLARVHHEYLNEENINRAAYCGFWLGIVLMSKGERARSSGWFARSQRLLENQKEDCVERGLLLIPVALQCLYGGDPEKSYELFQQVGDKGKRFNDPDLKTLSRLGSGQALIMQKKIPEGVAMLDEAMVSVESDNVSPIAVGIVYCAVVETCQKIFDIRRAREWTTALSKWCQSQPDMVPFRGQCLIRRSQIMHINGDWPEALDEMQRACQILSRPPGEPAAGEAYYQLAEIYRLRGDFNHAEQNYGEANKYGRKPQPGLSLLRLAQNQADAAVTSVQNALNEAKNYSDRISILPAYIQIMIAAGISDNVQAAVDELTSEAEKLNTTYLNAIAAYASGELFLSQGNTQEAMDALRKAYKLWQELNIPYEIAHVRLLLGVAYRKVGDEDSAALEITGAQWIFKKLDAIPDLKKADKLTGEKKKENFYGLTNRELQVLRLVASGETNKSIADKLFISERTVDRHLSNIFNKLNVASRTAASTFALKHKLV